MTPFSFEHVFLATPEALLSAFFEPAHVVEQDRALGVVEREILELVDGEQIAQRTSRVVPTTRFPPAVRRFAPKPEYLERVTWHKPSHELAIDMRLLGDRGQVAARYTLEQIAVGSIRRRYTGHVSVNIALIAGRIERGIIAEFERSLAASAACTQSWLDRQSQHSVAARA
jgi:hypothetical protein